MGTPMTADIDWIEINPKALPDETDGPFLVSNNITARNASGAPSHVWVVSRMHLDDDHVIAFGGSFETIRFITHYLPVGEIGRLRPMKALGDWLGFSASVIKSGEPWTETCARDYAAASRELAEARPILRTEIEAALAHAVNYHGVDSGLGQQDTQIAALLVGEVYKHLLGQTDVQVLDRMSPEERAKIGQDA